MIKIFKNIPGNEKANQKAFKVIAASVLMVGAVGFAIFTSDDSKDNNTTKKSEIKANNLINENDLVKSKWMGDAATNIDKVNAAQTETEKQNQELKEQMKKMQDSIDSLQKEKSETGQEDDKSLFMPIRNGQKPKDAIRDNGTFKNFPMPFGQNNSSGFADNQAQQAQPRYIQTTKMEKLNNTLGMNEVKGSEEDKDEGPRDKNTSNNPAGKEEILPTGSITKIVLLSGFDAPTMSQAKTNPLPIIMKLQNTSILPNRYKYDLRECVVMGEGYGDLSSERVYIRTNNLSCVTRSGKHVDMPFKGMITGEDGKVGLRGRVVTKQGSLIARSLIAGFLDGVGKAFNQSQQYTLVGSGGTTTGTQTMSTGQALQYGALGGASAAAEKLASFYLKMADQISPVIEINARRTADLISTQPTVFKFVENGLEKEKK